MEDDSDNIDPVTADDLPTTTGSIGTINAPQRYGMLETGAKQERMRLNSQPSGRVPHRTPMAAPYRLPKGGLPKPETPVETMTDMSAPDTYLWCYQATSETPADE